MNEDGTPLDSARSVRVFGVGGSRFERHAGKPAKCHGKLVRLPDLRLSFAAVAQDGSVERMTALSSLVEDALLRETT